MAPRLIIIQNHPTQFDAPFYAYIEGQGQIELHVYYTDPGQGSEAVDVETGHAPRWDHLAGCRYRKKSLTPEARRNCRAVVDEIAALRPDHVIVAGYMPLVHARIAWGLKRRGVSIGLRSDNTLYHSSFRGVKGGVKHFLLPWWLSRYDVWHPVGTLALEYLRKMSRRRRPVFSFPYNVDNDWFAGESARHRLQASSIRASMGFAGDDFVILGVMKWNDREDPLTLLRAFELLRQQGHRCKLVLVGDGPLREKVHARCVPWQDTVFLPGYAAYSELPRYYAIADVYVHPSVNEPWGVSVNEAMACGVPVVAARGVGAGVDLIVEGETGFTFANGDAAELVARIHRLGADAELLRAMRGNVRTRVAQWSYPVAHNEFLRMLG